MLTIHSNGTGFDIDKPWFYKGADTIEVLLQVLKEHALDKTFEQYGNFIMTNVELRNGTKLPKGTVRFFGNFRSYSHVFRIDTDKYEVIQQLTNAINENKLREDYINQEIFHEVFVNNLIQHCSCGSRRFKDIAKSYFCAVCGSHYNNKEVTV